MKRGVGHRRRVGIGWKSDAGQEAAALVSSIPLPTDLRFSSPRWTLRREKVGTARNQSKARTPGCLLCEAAARLE